MHLTSLHVQRFRGIREARIEGLGRVNLLLGRNNAGKTSLLEALFIAAGIGDPRRFEIIDALRGLRTSNSLDDFGPLFYGLRTEETMGFSARYDRLNVGRGWIRDASFAAEVRSSSGGTFEQSAFEQLGIFDEEREGSVVESLQVRVEGSEFSNPFLASIYRRARSSARYQGRARLLKEGEPPEFGRSALVTANSLPAGLEERLEALIVRKDTERLVEVLRSVDERIKGFSLGSGGRIYLDAGFPTLLPLGVMGDGVKRMLSIVATAATTEAGLVCIDEIDNGLHPPTSLRLLWKALLEAADVYNLQVIATTHSHEALVCLTEVLEEETYAGYASGVCAFDVVRGREDEVRTYCYDADQLRSALQHDIDVRA